MATEVKVPTLGESITEATLGQWLKQPGDAVKADEPIASLETDKVAVEVPSPVDGVMGEQLVGEGDNVEVGAVIARIEAGKGAASEARAEAPVNPAGAGENIEAREPDVGEHDETPHLTLSPAVRRVVLEHHLDPSKIKGTGKDGRLTKDDVLAAAKTQKASQGGAEEKPSPASAPAPAPSPPPHGTWRRRTRRPSLAGRPCRCP